MKLTPDASTRTSAWPSPGRGSGMSSQVRTSGPPRLWMRMAFTLPPSCRPKKPAAEDRLSQGRDGGQSGSVPVLGGAALQPHPPAAELLEMAGVLGRQGFLAEALDLRGRGAGTAHAIADGAHESKGVPAAHGNSNFRIHRSHLGPIHTYNVGWAENVSPPPRQFPYPLDA